MMTMTIVIMWTKHFALSVCCQLPFILFLDVTLHICIYLVFQDKNRPAEREYKCVCSLNLACLLWLSEKNSTASNRERERHIIGTATNKQLLCIIKSNLCSCFDRLAYFFLLLLNCLVYWMERVRYLSEGRSHDDGGNRYHYGKWCAQTQTHQSWAKDQEKRTEKLTEY